MNIVDQILRKAGDCKPGDRVCFKAPGADYVIESVEETHIGMVRHQHPGGSSAYWPDELLWVRGVPGPVTVYMVTEVNEDRPGPNGEGW